MIPVTKPFLPPIEEYQKLVEGIWNINWLTNNGPLVQELEAKLKGYLGVENLLYVSNGTIAIQIALKQLNITKEVITTPFSYVATTSSLVWEGCTPIYVDIDTDTFNIDATKIEAAITPNTQAILATHVFGNPCDIDTIDLIAKKHKLKVIYDAAHCFSTNYKGKSIFNYGDVSTTSFHATKIFHTIEGGAIISKNENLIKKLKLKSQFGHEGDTHFTFGINAKNSEFHAAMGLCNIRYIDSILERRKQQWVYYYNSLKENADFQLLTIAEKEFNYAYYPIVFMSELKLFQTLKALKAKEVFPRRYFYPSLNTLSYLDNYQICPKSESIAKRVICLPLYNDLTLKEQLMVIKIILQEAK